MPEVQEQEQAKEVHATPTAQIEFVGGTLHQVFIVSYSDGSSRPEQRPVPSKPGEAPSEL